MSASSYLRYKGVGCSFLPAPLKVSETCIPSTGLAMDRAKGMEYEDHCLQEPSAAICKQRDGQVPASLARGYPVHVLLLVTRNRVRTAAAGHEATTIERVA
jgi:hypothetical protein